MSVVTLFPFPGGGSSGATEPVQTNTLHSLSGTGVLALSSAPTPGNLIVVVVGSTNGTPSAPVVPGFLRVGNFESSGNTACALWVRRVQSGDTGSVSMTGRFAAVIYEFANANGVLPIVGGQMDYFSGADFTLPLYDSYFG